MKRALGIRRLLKSKKPNFVRGDSNKEKCKTRLKWRKPRGLHNKRRLNKKGHQKNPSVGFKSPKEVKNLTRAGLIPFHIANLNDLRKLNKEIHSAIISSTVGLKNKLKILEKCLLEEIKISGIKDIKIFIEESKNKLKEKKKVSITRSEKRKKEVEAAEKKKKEKENKKDSKDKQEEIKKEVLESKQKKDKKLEDISSKKDTNQAKGGHQASNVPGTKQ
jgi:large subunit ribosomal protein L32e